MIRRIFEALVRPLLRAPMVVTDLEVDEDMNGRWVSLPAQSLMFMGIDDGGHATANNLPVRVMEGDDPSCSQEVAEKVGTVDIVMRRRVLYVFFREIWSLSWTLVGMVTVLITLSGDAQKIAAIAVLLGLVLHSMTLRVSRTPRK
jgi:hypothetical protein